MIVTADYKCLPSGIWRHNELYFVKRWVQDPKVQGLSEEHLTSDLTPTAPTVSPSTLTTTPAPVPWISKAPLHNRRK